jgi:hypothetical protein
VNLADLQDLTFRNGAVTFLSIRLDNPSDQAGADRVAAVIESMDKLTVSRSESILRMRACSAC